MLILTRTRWRNRDDRQRGHRDGAGCQGESGAYRRQCSEGRGGSSRRDLRPDQARGRRRTGPECGRCEGRRRRLNGAFGLPPLYLDFAYPGRVSSRAPRKGSYARPERWPSGRRRAPAKGVWVKSPYSSRQISPIIQALTTCSTVV